MIVQAVVAPGVAAASWTVVDDGFCPVQPAETYLAHLEAIERSPNTVRACASSLRLWFEHLAARGATWDGVGLDELGRFVSALRSPAPGVVVVDGGTPRRSAATVNRHLAAVFGLYDFHARRGVEVARELVA
jgi:site-specific recombinase XerD